MPNTTIESGLPDADLSAVVDGSDVPALVAIGEPMHGSDDILRARYALARDLITTHGFRSIAIESDFHRSPVVDEYVRGGDVALETALAEGLTHEFVNANDATRDLLGWVRTFNAQTAEPVRLYGFDGPLEMHAAPSPREFLVRVRDALHVKTGRIPHGADAIELVAGDDARWTEQQAMYDAGRSVGRTDDAVRLRVIADDLCGAIESAAAEFAADPEGWWAARADARTGVGLLRYHALMATDVPERYGLLSAQRDTMMAANLVEIAGRESARGGTVVLGHNLHLQRGTSTMTMGGRDLAFTGGGALAEARLGGRYRFVATAIGRAPSFGLGVPEPGTVEGELYRAQDGGTVLHCGAELAQRLVGTAARTDRDERGAYFPLAPDRLADADGVLFLREVRA